MGLIQRWRNRGCGEHFSGLDRRDELPTGFKVFRGVVIAGVAIIGLLALSGIIVPGSVLWNKYKKGEMKSPEDLAGAMGDLNATLNQRTVRIPGIEGNGGQPVDTSALDQYMAPILAKGDSMTPLERQCVDLYNKLKAFLVLKGDVSGVRGDLLKCLGSLPVINGGVDNGSFDDLDDLEDRDDFDRF
ncbi:MAG: hypothetical protein US89_C0006G0032 [Candidatus Peregrinibacteria bacterium GW2011_GWF2_38_29]|nr:MAG: hypothetical protein US89_C0006G0032 [Candidatus Peregrinibacteria bacterium GW2011_GWF2_38_29]HBB03223.1 hypothetical protein [Candidatus Peregrinibacteria bacterium]